MFLNKLNGDEKLAFIALARKIQIADGVLSAEEEMTIQGYYHEMNLFGEKEVDYSVDEILDIFNNSTVEIKKIVIFEAYGLAYADGACDQSERDLIENVATRLGISKSVYNDLEDFVLKYIVLVSEISEKLKDNYIG